jgi:hypothetical protein
MRGKILDAFFEKDTGVSCVTKHTKYGTFTGESYCHPDNKDIMNEWDGCRFAEFKCDMQALHEKIKMMKQRLVGMDQLIDLLDRPEVAEQIDYSLYKDVVDLRNSVQGQIEVDINKYDAMRSNYQDNTERVLQHRRKFRAED